MPDNIFDAALTSKPVTRGELFNITSMLFRICTYQQMLIHSLRTPAIDDFDAESVKSERELDSLYSELNKLIGHIPNED